MKISDEMIQKSKNSSVGSDVCFKILSNGKLKKSWREDLVVPRIIYVNTSIHS